MRLSSKTISSNNLGRRLVIPDIHGCLKTLKSLLDRIDLSHKDQLFFLGDYVNKGPSSPETLDFLITFRRTYENCHFIMGNHDFAILNHLTKTEVQSEERLSSWNSSSFNNHPKTEQYIQFLDSLYHFIELEDYYLVHAGFDFESTDTFTNQYQMMNIVGFRYDSAKAKFKKIVHGHLPTPIEEIERNLILDKPIIPLDNGCVYRGERKGHGKLLCLDIDTNELIKQNKLD